MIAVLLVLAIVGLALYLVRLLPRVATLLRQGERP